MKKPSQTPKGVPVGQNVAFKPAKQVYQNVSKKPTVNTGINKKKEASMSNPFDVLTLVKYDVDLRTNGGLQIWPSKRLILEVAFVDNKGNPLEKVVSLGDYNSEDEVASVDNEMASFFARNDGYGTNSLLEQ
ncbi:hypothetical protein Tco_1396766 [Tanacetum coccineum]